MESSGNDALSLEPTAKKQKSINQSINQSINDWSTIRTTTNQPINQSINQTAYLLLDVLKRRWTDDGKAHEKHVSLGIAQRSKAIIILLPSRVEQAQRVRLTADHNGHGVVIKDLQKKNHNKDGSTSRRCNRKVASFPHTVGTYSDGNLFVVYEISRPKSWEKRIGQKNVYLCSVLPSVRSRVNIQVFPTAPSPTTTHFMVCIFRFARIPESTVETCKNRTEHESDHARGFIFQDFP